MVSRGFGGGMGQGYGSMFDPLRKRLGAGRIDPNMRDPNYQPPPQPNVFDPYEDKPYGRGDAGPQEAAPTNDMMNIYRGLPGFNPLMMSKDQVPSRFRVSSGVGQSSTGFGRLNQLSDAAMRYRGMGQGGGFAGGMSQGFGEGYQSDALRRLLMARLGGGM